MTARDIDNQVQGGVEVFWKTWIGMEFLESWFENNNLARLRQELDRVTSHSKDSCLYMYIYI